MKRILFDFECAEDGVFEELVYSEDKETPCPKCGKVAQRIISNVRIDWRSMGVSSDFPTCADKWEKMQREKSRKEDSSNLKMY
jgi:putative FmdB family regulatory protein